MPGMLLTDRKVILPIYLPILNILVPQVGQVANIA